MSTFLAEPTDAIAALAPLPEPASTAPTDDPDAELIRICGEHAVNVKAVNADRVGELDETDPLWMACARTKDAITAMRPRTFAGMVAKMRAAKAEATLPDGTEDPDGTPAVRWVWSLLDDLLAGEIALPAAASEPVGPHPDAELIAACAEYMRVQQEFDAYYRTLPGDMEDDDPNIAILAPIADLRNRIATLRATTGEGHLARARCMAFHLLPGHSALRDDPDGAPEDRFSAANLRDAVAMKGRVV